MSKRARDPQGKLYRVESIVDTCGMPDPLHPELLCSRERFHRVNIHEASDTSDGVTHTWLASMDTVQLPADDKEDAVTLPLRQTL